MRQPAPVSAFATRRLYPVVVALLVAGQCFVSRATEAAERRVALVIGNAAYRTSPLTNPVNDARDMAAALRQVGFEVIEKTDATQKEMLRAIIQFGEKLRSDSVALFFYAGHGMQVKGKNFLVPVDAQIASEASVRAETVDVDSVMDQLSVSALNIIILDACRNNPFERRFRSVGGGLAQMDAPKGSLIAYATAHGKTAADGDGRNGLYTQELLKYIRSPGLPVEAVFKRVRNGVMQGSGDAQTPWESSSLTGEFYFKPGGSPQMPSAVASAALAPNVAVPLPAKTAVPREEIRRAETDARPPANKSVVGPGLTAADVKVTSEKGTVSLVVRSRGTSAETDMLVRRNMAQKKALNVASKKLNQLLTRKYGLSAEDADTVFASGEIVGAESFNDAKEIEIQYKVVFKNEGR